MELEMRAPQTAMTFAEFVVAIQQRLPATAAFEGDIKLLLSHADAVYSVMISGRPERSTVVHEGSGRADTAIRATLDDLWGVLHGQKNLGKLFADGRIQVDGDLNLAIVFAGSLAAEDEAALAQARITTSERLAASQPPVLEIARVADLQPRELQDHARLGRPVILTRAVEDWPMRKATWQELPEAFRGMRSMVFGGPVPGNASSREQHMVPISDFIQEIIDDTPSLHTPGGSVRYLATQTVPEGAMHLLDFPPHFPREAYRADCPRMWIGPRDTVTAMHREAVDNVVVQVLGRKSWVLAAPDESDKLYTQTSGAERAESRLYRGGQYVQVDPNAPDLARFPRFADARLLRFVLEPGEMLFLPHGWFHYVRALESAVSVNFWLRHDYAF